MDMYPKIPDDEIPPADNPGGTGEQTAGSTVLSELLPSYHYRAIVASVKGLAEGKPKALGGDASAAIMSGLIESMANQLNAGRDDAAAKEKRADRIRDELSVERSRTAALTEQVRSMRQLQTAMQVCMTCASILVGIAVDTFKSNNRVAYVIGGVALVLIVGGWAWPRLKERKDA